MSTNPGQPTLQELMSRVAALEQAHASLLAELTSGRGAGAAADEQKLSGGTAVAMSAPPGNFASNVAVTPAVTARGTAGATGVQASSDGGNGVLGTSIDGIGVLGQCTRNFGVNGFSNQGTGVYGQSNQGTGVVGQSTNGKAGEFLGDVSVSGHLSSGAGTFAGGVSGQNNARGSSGVSGQSTDGTGVFGQSDNSRGVEGESPRGRGVFGQSTSGVGVFGLSSTGPGVHGESLSGSGQAGEFIGNVTVSGNVGIGTTTPQAKLDISGGATEGLHIANTNQSPFALMINNTTVGSTDATGFGLWQSDAGIAVLTNHNNYAISITPSGNVGIGTTTPSAKLTVQGDVSVTGDVVLTGADCAEEFDIAEAAEIEPGTVMVVDQDGALQQSQRAYDKRVAGVISGAGNYKPGLILDRQQSQDNRLPIALVGKVYCKVDAQYAPIEVGDLLTTSSTPGHAMKADDPLQAFGSVIGKALRPLQAGQGMIPILIAMQ